MLYQLYTSTGQVIASNLDPSCRACALTCTSKNELVKCSASNSERRRGIRHSKGMSIYGCSSDRNIIQSSHRLAISLDAILESSQTFINLREDVVARAQADMIRFRHNIVSLNAHNIQEAYNLVPQDSLTGDLYSQLQIVKEKMKSAPDRAAHFFFQSLKNNVAIRNENLAYDKLNDPSPNLSIRSHPIRKVILHVYHVFYSDFSASSIRPFFQPNETRINFDYETVSAALYHIMENASKYIRPNSELKVDFRIKGKSFLVEISMTSAKIFTDELGAIFTEGYRGKQALALGRGGTGMGLSTAKRFLALNDADISIYTDIDGKGGQRYNNCIFENNLFEIEFKNRI